MIELFTPFRTPSGEEISLQFACGNNVSVNCILGMPYFKQFGVSLDTVNHKVIAQKVDYNPFDISYKMPSSEAPKLPKGATKFNQKKISTTAVVSIAALARRANCMGPQLPKCAEPSLSAIDFAAAPPKMKKPRHEWSDDDQSLFSASSDENMEYVDAATLAGYGDEG